MEYQLSKKRKITAWVIAGLIAAFVRNPKLLSKFK